MSSFWIQTASGGDFDLGDPQPDMVHFHDMAISLSKISRFTGHLKSPDTFYPVSEHLCNCAWQSWFVLDETQRRDRALNDLIAREAFGHDFHEAYTGDWSTPMKRLLEDRFGEDFIDKIVGPVDAAVREAMVMLPRQPHLVHVIDQKMLLTEHRDLMAPGTHSRPAWKAAQMGYTPFHDPMSDAISPRQAYKRFMFYGQVLGFTQEGK